MGFVHLRVSKVNTQRVLVFVHMPKQSVEVKGKVIPILDMTACRGSERIAPLILNHSTIRRWVVNITPRPLYPGIQSIGSRGEKYYADVKTARQCPCVLLVNVGKGRGEVKKVIGVFEYAAEEMS
jgi:hypothetical protein